MINKIKKLIIDGDISIKYVKHFRGFKGIPIKGFYDPENDIILINDSLTPKEKIITIIHEYLHDIYPEWTESKVETTCLNLYKQLNEQDHLFFRQL